jgi:hypothetical protein
MEEGEQGVTLAARRGRLWRRLVVFAPVFVAILPILLIVVLPDIPEWLRFVLILVIVFAAVLVSAFVQTWSLRQEIKGNLAEGIEGLESDISELRQQRSLLALTPEQQEALRALVRRPTSARQIFSSLDFWLGRVAVSFVFFLLGLTAAGPVNHYFAMSRDREQRHWDIRRDHLARLRPVLLADADKLAEIAKQLTEQGRLTSFNRDPTPNQADLAARFSPAPLSDDVVNHHRGYAQEKKHLREATERQDREHVELVLRLLPRVRLPSNHPYRELVVRSFVWKCLGSGDGMTLKSSPSFHNYSWLGSTGGASGPASQEHQDAFAAYTALRPDAQTATQCQTLKTRKTEIIATATRLSSQARLLAEHTTLNGECEYTRRP